MNGAFGSRFLLPGKKDKVCSRQYADGKKLAVGSIQFADGSAPIVFIGCMACASIERLQNRKGDKRQRIHQAIAQRKAQCALLIDDQRISFLPRNARKSRKRDSLLVIARSLRRSNLLLTRHDKNIYSRKDAKLPRPAYAPDLHSCKPRPPRKTFAPFAFLAREILVKLDSFVNLQVSQ